MKTDMQTDVQKSDIEGFRLSPQQQRVWLHRRDGGDRAYRVVGTILVDGTVDSHALEDSLKRIVGRHEILRTTFECPPGMSVPIQVISPNVMLSFRRVDLSALDPEMQGSRTEELVQGLHAVTFDPAHGPLIHAYLVTMAPTRRALLVGLSALCGDAATLQNLLKEIAADWDAKQQHREADASASPQYADLAEWQFELLGSEDASAGIEFWRKQTTTATLAARLPSESAPGDSAMFEPTHRSSTLDYHTAARIREVASRTDTSASAFFLACWQVLLSRLTAVPDLTIAVGCHGRTYEELVSAVGLLTKYLPVRASYQGETVFSALMRKTRDAMVEAFEYQEYFSWDRLAVSPPAGNRPPFAPFGFDFETIPAPQSLAGGVTMSLDRLEHCVERFKVRLSIEERADTFSAAVHYDSNVLHADDAERLLGRFLALVNNATANPESVLDDLNVLTEAERHQLLIEFNDTHTDYPRDRCVFQLIEEQAARVSDAVAVTLGDDELTYAQLNGRANQLARHLQKLGVGPGVMVGVYLEQSIDVVVGLVGIMKAGAAYVPLDRDYPKDRIRLILQDTQAPVLITQRALLDEIQDYEGRTVCLDSDWGVIGGENNANMTPRATPDDRAYVIYTSGSTGRPKGVPISHRNLMHSTHARTLYYREPVGRYLLLSSFSFDSSVAGIFWTLGQGGTLVLPPAGLQRDPMQVAELIARHQVTHVLCLPSLYGLLLSDDNTSKLSSLRTIVVAGEACPTDLVDTHQDKLPHATLFNEYGPTEGTVWSTVFDCRSHKPGASVPIGRPIPNVQAYVLNRRLQPVPIGVPGELYIGGAGVAKGYFNQPALNAEKFLDNPFFASESADPSDDRKRLYRTGDLARYLPDGNIEFLGRVDQQVKIRGYRIELGEIEAVLGQHLGVRQAVVAAREDTVGDKRLVAYIVARPDRSVPIDELKSFLAKKIPDFMIPSTFVFLDELPLNANGKIDRNALPAPDSGRSNIVVDYVPPRNDVERLIAQIWSEVLKVDKVGVFDNFFELGGHSILAARLIARLRAALQIELPMRSLFLESTVAGLSKHIRYDAARQSYEYLSEIPKWKCLVPIQPKGSRPPLFLVAGAHSDEEVLLRFLSHMIPHLGLDQPIFGFKPRGLDGEAEPHTSVEEIAREFVAEVRAVQPAGPYLIAGECRGGIVAFEMAQQLTQQGAPVKLLALLDTHRPTPMLALSLRAELLRGIPARYLTKIWKVLRLNHPTAWARTFFQLADRKRREVLPRTKDDVRFERVQRTEREYPLLTAAYRAIPYTGLVTVIANEQNHARLPDLGWTPVAKGGLEVHVVPGNHITRLTQHAQNVADRLLRSIDEALTDGEHQEARRSVG